MTSFNVRGHVITNVADVVNFVVDHCRTEINNIQGQKLGKIFTGPTYNLLLSFTVISDVSRPFIPNKTAFTQYSLTQWISKLSANIEIH